ncbi:MAG: hypothetical protein IJ287_08585 [Methanobrevibacter sp.]|nr:hypothetical protein [Methanobrevibacter sp.]
MRECANCGKQMRDSFTYCRVCGTKLEDGVPGDYSTDMLNVFTDDDEYIYLFAENGNQVVLRADSLDGLAAMVEEKKYPWEFREWKDNIKPQKRQTVEIPKFKSDFLKASSLKEPEIIPAASTRKQKDESYIPEYEIEKVMND